MDNIITKINVINNNVKIMEFGNIDYISLTDLARYANKNEPKIPIQTRMRNKDVILYLGLWETLNNENFKGLEFTTFKNMNAELINQKISQKQRLIKLNDSAKRQMKVLVNNNNIKKLELLEDEYNKLIELTKN